MPNHRSYLPTACYSGYGNKNNYFPVKKSIR